MIKPSLGLFFQRKIEFFFVFPIVSIHQDYVISFLDCLVFIRRIVNLINLSLAKGALHFMLVVFSYTFRIKTLQINKFQFH